jgi:hypothetical protein
MQNKPAGFKTDRPEGYPEPVIISCACMAAADGLTFMGNQYNIIGGQYFVAKNGWRYRLEKLGASRILAECGMPEEEEAGQPNQKGACRFTAKFSGRASCQIGEHKYAVEFRKGEWLDTRLYLSSYTRDISDAADQMRGKAEARLLKKLYYFASGEAYIPDLEEAVPTVETIEPARIEQAAPAEQLATEEQREMAEKCVTGITAANTLEELGEAWKAVNSLKKSQALTAEQIRQLTELKDLRKKALSAG